MDPASFPPIVPEVRELGAEPKTGGSDVVLKFLSDIKTWTSGLKKIETASHSEVCTLIANGSGEAEALLSG